MAGGRDRVVPLGHRSQRAAGAGVGLRQLSSQERRHRRVGDPAGKARQRTRPGRRGSEIKHRMYGFNPQSRQLALAPVLR